MKKINAILVMFVMGLLCPVMSSAQIGYQVSLLNTATGEPRANVTVNATVAITNSVGDVIYSGTQSVPSNDFGILQLTVGNEDTFKNVDWSKLPLFIEVSIDGAMIAKSQILSVPVAEVAKRLAPAITPEELEGFWVFGTGQKWDENGNYLGEGELGFTFNKDYTGFDDNEYEKFTYEIEGNDVILYEDDGEIKILKYFKGRLFFGFSGGKDKGYKK